MSDRVSIAIACLLLPVAAAAEPLVFLRVDQAGGLDRGGVGASYTLEAARAVLAVQGSADRGDAYTGATHRITAAYGVLDWLTVGVEQSLRQVAGDQLRIGVLAPEVRARLDAFGLPVEGLGAYVQGRVRVTAQRPSSLVGGLVLDRGLGAFVLAARLGFEATVVGTAPELGFRSELGISRALGESWKVSAEEWGSSRWVGGVPENDYHVGPSLQVRWKALKVGLQLGVGEKAAAGLLVVDGVAMVRAALGF